MSHQRFTVKTVNTIIPTSQVLATCLHHCIQQLTLQNTEGFLQPSFLSCKPPSSPCKTPKASCNIMYPTTMAMCTAFCCTHVSHFTHRLLDFHLLRIRMLWTTAQALPPCACLLSRVRQLRKSGGAAVTWVRVGCCRWRLWAQGHPQSVAPSR